jgi:hypothetical protein
MFSPVRYGRFFKGLNKASNIVRKSVFPFTFRFYRASSCGTPEVLQRPEFLDPSVGKTGGVVLGVSLAFYAIAEEIFILDNSENALLIAFTIFCITAYKKIGGPLYAFLKKDLDTRIEEFAAVRRNKIAFFEKKIANCKEQQQYPKVVELLKEIELDVAALKAEYKYRKMVNGFSLLFGKLTFNYFF